MRVKIAGLRDLDRAMSELKATTARNVARRSFKQVLEPMAEEARSGVAEDWSGELRASIGVSSAQPKGRYKRLNKIEVHMGPGRQPQGIQEEFGNRRQSPRPFMGPAWDHGKEGALDATAKILAEEVQKSAQRAARKAARQARKLGA